MLATAGFRHAFPARDASDAELLAALGAARVVQVKQVHGARAVLSSEAEGQEADAVIARGGGVAVGVRVADCVPVLIADVASGDVAAIHAGWRGVVGGVVRAGVELLGGKARVAAIGPCIGACCFEVGREVAEQIGFTVHAKGDKAYVDLRAAVRAQLRALGIDDRRIEDVPGCTKHEGERFHSFRRDGANSGRMLAAVTSRAP
ncbi:MAG TPA: polyphenol oxidase family protein [Polyangiaceae bacterium]